MSLRRLHVQANELRMSQAEIAQATLHHKRQQAAEKEARRRAGQLGRTLEDGLLAGLTLMLGATMFCGVKCGYLGTKIQR